MTSVQGDYGYDSNLVDKEKTQQPFVDERRMTGGGEQLYPSPSDGGEKQPLLQDEKSDSRSGIFDEREQRKREELPPLKYCRFIVEYPKLAFGLTMSGHLAMVAVTGLLILLKYDIIPMKNLSDSTLHVRYNNDYLRDVAWDFRRTSHLTIMRGYPSNGTEKLRSRKGECIELYFEQRHEGDNVLTKKNLQTMQEIEDFFWNNTEFQNNFCLKTKTEPYSCAKPTSVLRLFDGTYKYIDSGLYDPTFDKIPEILSVAKKHSFTVRGLRYALGKKHTINATHAIANIARSAICTGKPLMGFKNASDRRWEQFDRTKDFLVVHFMSDLEENFHKGVGEMNFFYGGKALLYYAIKEYAIMDLFLLTGSIIFITFILFIQTGSFWVTGWAMFGITTGFFGANLIYRVVLDYCYFGLFQILALFILMCIGADDVFVFYDTWKFTAQHTFDSLAHRLSFCYRKAAVAMFFTSMTTAIAFSVTLASPLLGVHTFGLFSALLICVNYVSVIVYFPTVIVTYHVFWDSRVCCCCGERDEILEAKSASMSTAEFMKPGSCYNSVVRFLSGPYFRFITHPVKRWAILVFFACMISTAVYLSTLLEINVDNEVKVVSEKTNFGRFLKIRASKFAAHNEYVILIWGLKNQDLRRCHKTDYKCMGETVWDDSFSLESPAAQQALMDLCHKLKTMSKADRERLYVVEDDVTGHVEVDCFMDEMKTFYQAEGHRKFFGNHVYPNNTALAVPFIKKDARHVIQYNPFIYNQKLPDNFSRYFEVGLSFWMFNAFQPPYPSKQYLRYGRLLGEHSVPNETLTVNLPAGGKTWFYQYGTKLRYAAIKIKTDLKWRSLGFSKGLPLREEWERLVVDAKKDMPASLQGGFQICEGQWHWYLVQKILVRSAMMGILIGLIVAFPIFVFATENIVTGTVAMTCVVLNTICVIAVIPLGGWKLGVTESINLTLVVGLSVDYVVHLAQGYSRSLHLSRLGRLQDTLAEVGISVLSGALTTVGGSAFLLLAKITYFVQFGLILFATIFFSIVFALGFMSTVLGIMGPENDYGSIRKPIEWLIDHVSCNEDKEEKTHREESAPD